MESIVCPLCGETTKNFSDFARHLIHHEKKAGIDPPRVWNIDPPRVWKGILQPLVQGDTMKIAKDEDIIEGLLYLADYSSHEHPWGLRYEVKAEEVYVEAGGYHARYARKIVSRLGDKVDIILIEPAPINAAVIRAYIKREGLKNVTLIEKAIGNEQKSSKFIMRGPPFVYGHLGSSGDIFTTVEVDTLDNMMADLGVDHIDLLTSDIEGAEEDLVKGAEHLLSEKRIRNVAIAAYHRAQAMSPLVQKVLRRHGYMDIEYIDGVVYGHA